MKTIRNLAVVAALAAVYGLLKWLFGDSLLTTFGFFLTVFAVVMLAFNVKGWPRLVLCAASATAVSATYQSLFPADSVWKVLALVLLTAAVLGPLARDLMKEARHS
jgi:hypothetical protein